MRLFRFAIPERAVIPGRPEGANPESMSTNPDMWRNGFRVRAIQVGSCRLGLMIQPNSGKPEFDKAELG